MFVSLGLFFLYFCSLFCVCCFVCCIRFCFQEIGRVSISKMIYFVSSDTWTLTQSVNMSCVLLFFNEPIITPEYIDCVSEKWVSKNFRLLQAAKPTTLKHTCWVKVFATVNVCDYSFLAYFFTRKVAYDTQSRFWSNSFLLPAACPIAEPASVRARTWPRRSATGLIVSSADSSLADRWDATPCWVGVWCW